MAPDDCSGGLWYQTFPDRRRGRKSKAKNRAWARPRTRQHSLGFFLLPWKMSVTVYLMVGVRLTGIIASLVNCSVVMTTCHQLYLHCEGRWGSKDYFTTSFIHFSLFSTALWNLAICRPVHSLMLSSHLFICLPWLLPPLTVSCKMVLTRPDEQETVFFLSFFLSDIKDLGLITCQNTTLISSYSLSSTRSIGIVQLKEVLLK